MITRIQLTGFKSFQQASLQVGGLTILVGTNASGKSNLRDALRFIHGIGRGYAFSDSIGGRFGEGGERIWGGIRGGPREIVFDGARTFAIEVTSDLEVLGNIQTLIYRIEVDPGQNGRPATLVSESLRMQGDASSGYLFRADTYRDDMRTLRVWVRRWDRYRGWRSSPLPNFDEINHQLASGELRDAGDPRMHAYSFDPIVTQRPALVQIAESSNKAVNVEIHQVAQALLSELASMRFLDLSPDAMRQPSFPGQLTLGDRGENLSSVLQAICADETNREILVGWLQALTPLDAVDFDFPADPIGRVVATLIEANGRRTTAYSASDGTLRFLAMLAAMLGPEPARLYVFEELENGIHPTRLHLLLQLIEQQVAQGTTQVLATTHSPQLLRLLSPQTIQTTSIVYRLPDQSDSKIQRLLDIPDIERVLEGDDLAQLHESGWLEDAIAFTNAERSSL